MTTTVLKHTLNELTKTENDIDRKLNYKTFSESNRGLSHKNNWKRNSHSWRNSEMITRLYFSSSRFLSAASWPWCPSRCPHSTFLHQPASHAASVDTVSAKKKNNKKQFNDNDPASVPSVAVERWRDMSFELNKKGYENNVLPIFKNILEISPMYYSPLCQWRL